MQGGVESIFGASFKFVFFTNKFSPPSCFSDFFSRKLQSISLNHKLHFKTSNMTKTLKSKETKDRNIQKLAITELSSEEAMDFLMNTERYHDFELPEYFDFSEVLSFVRKKIKDKPYVECLAESGASNFTDVNFDILLNKDGSYAVRPLVLCNPYLYYFLAREICGKKNWEQVKANFKECEVPRIKSCALPIVPAENESFHKSTTILNWWNSIEQHSIELSLDYKYMFVTDITNCYGSVNPQSIDWALSRKGTKKETDENHEIASNIILLLKEMQQGRNIGIPQGSTLFDLTGEIVLCYSDLLLHEELEKAKIVDGYEILRYRDDYRVFCKTRTLLNRSLTFCRRFWNRSTSE